MFQKVRLFRLAYQQPKTEVAFSAHTHVGLDPQLQIRVVL